MENDFENHGVKNHLITRYCPYCKETNLFVVVEECHCHIDFDGAGYTHEDEYGPCVYCESKPVVCLSCNGNFSL